VIEFRGQWWLDGRPVEWKAPPSSSYENGRLVVQYRGRSYFADQVPPDVRRAKRADFNADLESARDANHLERLRARFLANEGFEPDLDVFHLVAERLAPPPEESEASVDISTLSLEEQTRIADADLAAVDADSIEDFLRGATDPDDLLESMRRGEHWHDANLEGRTPESRWINPPSKNGVGHGEAE
jgi:hypothetical protein